LIFIYKICPFTLEELQAIFITKCQDLKRQPTDIQMEIFFTNILDRCRGNIIDLRECGIGKSGMSVVAELIMKYKQFSILRLGLIYLLVNL
jgi:hypothetical protein